MNEKLKVVCYVIIIDFSFTKRRRTVRVSFMNEYGLVGVSGWWRARCYTTMYVFMLKNIYRGKITITTHNTRT